MLLVHFSRENFFSWFSTDFGQVQFSAVVFCLAFSTVSKLIIFDIQFQRCCLLLGCGFHSFIYWYVILHFCIFIYGCFPFTKKNRDVNLPKIGYFCPTNVFPPLPFYICVFFLLNKSSYFSPSQPILHIFAKYKPPAKNQFLGELISHFNVSSDFQKIVTQKQQYLMLTLILSYI